MEEPSDMSMYYRCTSCCECFFSRLEFFNHAERVHCKVLVCQGHDPEENTETAVIDGVSTETQTISLKPEGRSQDKVNIDYETAALLQHPAGEINCPAEIGVRREGSGGGGEDGGGRGGAGGKEERGRGGKRVRKDPPVTVKLEVTNDHINSESAACCSVSDTSCYNSGDSMNNLMQVVIANTHCDNGQNGVSNAVAYKTPDCPGRQYSINLPQVQNGASNAVATTTVGAVSSLAQMEMTEHEILNMVEREMPYAAGTMGIDAIAGRPERFFHVNMSSITQGAKKINSVQTQPLPPVRIRTVETVGNTLRKSRAVKPGGIRVVRAVSDCVSGNSTEQTRERFTTQPHVQERLQPVTVRTPDGGSDVSRSFANSHVHFNGKAKPYHCSLCSATFSKATALKSHVRFHTKEKLHHCEWCGISFPHSSNLITHMRYHTKEKPYECEWCGAAFAQSGNLNSHRRMHTGERPYKCDICGESYTRSNLLKQHQRKRCRAASTQVHEAS